MIDVRPKVGDQFIFNAVNWRLISARSNPCWIKVVVKAIDGDDIWYTMERDTKTYRTVVPRFMEIVKEDIPENYTRLDPPL